MGDLTSGARRGTAIARRTFPLSVGLLIIPMVLLAAAAPDVRPIVDDLCYEARMHTEGVLGTWTYYLTAWSGTWLQHLLSALVAAPAGYAGYAVQSAFLLAALIATCAALAHDGPGRAWLLRALGLSVCCCAALQGSLVGPAYPGLAGSFAFPAAGLLHLLPVLLFLPLTVQWRTRGAGTPPAASVVVLGVVLTGLGLAEAAAAALVWVGLSVRAAPAAAPRPPGRRGVTWLLGSATVGAGLLAVYFSPGSRNRAVVLALEPSSSALDGPGILTFPVYMALYLGGVATSPGVWIALVYGVVLGRRRLACVRAGSIEVLAASLAALVFAQAAAAVFANPAFWHLQPVQVAATVLAYQVGCRWGSARRPTGDLPAAPDAGVLLAAALVVLVALPPVLATWSAVRARAAAVDIARDTSLTAAGGAPATPPAYALGRRDGAVLPDAGAGAAGYGTCWAQWHGSPSIQEVLEPPGPRGVLPTLPLPVLGQRP